MCVCVCVCVCLRKECPQYTHNQHHLKLSTKVKGHEYNRHTPPIRSVDLSCTRRSLPAQEPTASRDSSRRRNAILSIPYEGPSAWRFSYCRCCTQTDWHICHSCHVSVSECVRGGDDMGTIGFVSLRVFK